jgi:hypothetical protein
MNINNKSILILILVASIHWVSIQLYNNFCMSYSIYGYLMNYLNPINPVCYVIFKIAYTSYDTYSYIWWAIIALVANIIKDMIANIYTVYK